MKIKQKLKTLTLAIIASVGIGMTLTPLVSADCGGAKTSIITCTQGAKPNTAKDSGIWGLLVIILNIMTAGVGVLAVGGVTYAAILYASSSDNADQTKQAKQIIKNTGIGIVVYAFMYLALNFVIPGGIFS